MRLFPRILFTAISLLVFSAPVSAQFTILPRTELDSAVCAQLLAQYEVDGIIPTKASVIATKWNIATNNYNQLSESLSKDPMSKQCEKTPGTVDCLDYEEKKKEVESAKQTEEDAKKEAMSEKGSEFSNSARDDLLACAIKSGQASLQMVPYFITYIANFLLAMIGIICILFIVLGGYYYIYGGLVDKKEKGKLTIIHALMGMGIALLAWVAVNAIITAVTS